MSYLELKGIRKSYYLGKEEFPVLKGIDLKFSLGEFVAILGESGGGKSTLMNIMGGLDRKFSGEVFVDGQKLDHSKEKFLDRYRREEIGYIYQAYNLISHLTVLDNVKLSLDMSELSHKEKIERSLDLLERVGLKEHANKYPNQLSGGQKQRVAIARALSSDPKIIIADEPTGALDAQNTEYVLDMLDEIAKEGRLVITVTHSNHVAEKGTRIVKMAEGVIEDDLIVRDPYNQSYVNKIKSKPLRFKHSVKTAMKHFKYHKLQNSLITLGTSIGLFSVIFFSGLGKGVGGYVDKQITDLVNPKAIAVVRYLEKNKKQGNEVDVREFAKSNAEFSKEEMDSLNKVKNIESIEKMYQIQNVEISYGDLKSTANISTWSKVNSNNTISDGKKPVGKELVIDKETIAKVFNEKNPKYLIGKEVTVKGFVQKTEKEMAEITFKAKVSGLSTSQAPASYISKEGFIDIFEENNLTPKSFALAIMTNSLDNTSKVTKDINEIKISGKRTFQATSVEETIKTVRTYIMLISNILAGVAGISLLVSVFMIVVTMFMSVAERTKEIGILRALGESKKDIRRLFISEGLIIGVVSATLATIISLLSQQGANHLLQSIADYRFIQITSSHIVTVYLIAILISLLAVWLPSRRAASLNPIEALSAD